VSSFPPDISFVVPARNEAAGIGACVDALVRQGDRTRVEVIVVDNGSSDATAAIATAHGARVVPEPRPGLAHARQAGLVAAHAPILVFVDADTLLPPGWASAALAEFRRRPGLVAFSPAFSFHDGRLVDNVGNGIFREVLCPLTNSVLLGLRRPGILIGSTMALRTAALRAAGGVDQAFQFYGEDTMIARRLAKFGEVSFVQHPRLHTSARRYQDRGLINVVYRYFTIFLLIQLGRIALAGRLARTYYDCDRGVMRGERCRAMLVAALRREQEQHEIAPVQDDLASSDPLLGLDT
jgi:glycosyltransferase involved in cell wall biosynthesis